MGEAEIRPDLFLGIPSRLMYPRKRFIPRTAENLSWAKDVLVPGKGPMPATIMGLGMNPGFTEATALPPAPFQPSAPAGGELDVYLSQIGLTRESLYLTNAYKFFVFDHFGSDRPPTQTELESQWDLLETEVAACEPKVIVCLGAVATKWMMKKAGLEYHTAECHRGMPVGYYGDAVLFSSTHPAAGIHSTDSMKFLVADFNNLKLIVRQASRGDRVKLPQDPYDGATDYRRLMNQRELIDVWADEIPFLSIDTEGTRKRPIMLQATWHAGSGYAIYNTDRKLIESFRDQVKLYTQIPGNKIFMHNALYDLGVLDSMGINLPDGSWIDTMVMAFLLGTEPLGLKPLAYRLCGMKMQSYEEQIGPRNEEMALDYLLEASLHDWPPAEEILIREGGSYRVYKPQSIGARINRILKDWAEQDSKIEHVTHVEMADINNKGEVKRKKHTHDHYVKKMGKCPEGCHEVKVEREEPVDLRDRWYKKGEKIEEDYNPEFETTGQMLRAPVEKMLGKMPEATLLDIPEQQAINYACRDTCATTRVGPILLERIRELDLELPLQIDMGIQPMLQRMMKVGIPADRQHFINFGKECRQRMDQIEYEIYKEVGRSINLASGPQLSGLLFGELRLPSTRWTKSRDQLAVDKKALEPLRYMHPIVPLVMEWGELETLKNNFAEVLPSKLDENSRIHCKIGMTRIPSGRLNTSDPNLMAQPTRSELGEQIRRGFIAPDGFKFVTIDAGQIELRCEGFLSMDSKLVEIFSSGRDAHTDTGAWMMGVNYEKMVEMLHSDDPVIHRRAKEKRAAGKTINFGLVNLITGVGLLDQFKLQGLAANPWAPQTKYLDPTVDRKGKKIHAVCQNVNGDPHRFIVLQGGISGGREPAWNFTPGSQTRDGNILLQEAGEGWTADKGNEFIAGWMKNYSGVPAWHETLFAEARRFGFVRDLFGRLRFSPEIFSSISRIQEAGKKVIANYPIQTTAINIIKIAMRLLWEQIKLWWERRMKVEPLLNIHDEILLLTEDSAVEEVGEKTKWIMGPGVQQEMARMGFVLPFPLLGAWGSGSSWGDISK